MATKLFGKGGKEMLPMLNEGGEALQKHLVRLKAVAYAFTPKDDANLKSYATSMVVLETAVGGLKNQVGAALAPVLQPVIDQFTKWVAANRDWIATGITSAVQGFATYLQQIDWDEIGTGLKDFGLWAKKALDAVGGLSGALKFLLMVRFANWSTSVVMGFAGITTGASSVPS